MIFKIEEKITWILILVAGVFLLFFSLFVNLNDSFDFLADPLVGDSLGTICSSPEACQEFCFDSRGICTEYCQANPTNELCSSLFRLII